MIKGTVPVWLPDEANSGIFVYWQNLLKYLDGEDLIFVSDAADAVVAAGWSCIDVATYRSKADSFTLPLLNLGVSGYYSKQLDQLFENGGLIFFHQLYLQRLMFNYFMRHGEKAPAAYMNYGRTEAGRLGELLAELSTSSSLMIQEYYYRTFALQLAKKSVGFASSWKGALGRLECEGLEPDVRPKFHYVPPFFDTDDVQKVCHLESAHPKNRRRWRFALLGHRSELKNPGFALDLIRELNKRGLPSQLVAIGSIGDMVKDLMLPGEQTFVEFISAPTNEDFISAMDTTDLVLHLRHPFGGEMAATVCEGMARGLPVVGFYKDWLADLPRDACIGLNYPATPRDASQLVVRVLQDPASLLQLRRRMDAYLREEGSVRHTIAAIRNLFRVLRSDPAEVEPGLRSVVLQ